MACVQLPNFAFGGSSLESGVLGHGPLTHTACCERCVSNSECLAFTVDRAGCWLKSSTLGLRSDTSATSGLVQRSECSSSSADVQLGTGVGVGPAADDVWAQTTNPLMRSAGFNWTQLANDRAANFVTGREVRLDSDTVRSKGMIWLHHATMARSLPAVVTGLRGTWPETMRSIASWDVAEFRRRWGEQEVEVSRQPDIAFYQSKPHPTVGRAVQIPDREVMPFRDFLDLLSREDRSREHVVIHHTSLYDLSEFGLPPLPPLFEELAAYTLNSRNLWVAKPPVHSALHFDWQDSVLLQVAGSKRFRCVDPTRMHTVYPALMRLEQLSRSDDGVYTKELLPEERTCDNRALVNVTHPDFEKHPLFRDAHVLTIDVHEGEALLLPGYWYHFVESFTRPGQPLNVAVNYWFQGNSFATRLRRTLRSNVFINCSAPAARHVCASTGRFRKPRRR